jgi:hypothetical protein
MKTTPPGKNPGTPRRYASIEAFTAAYFSQQGLSPDAALARNAPQTENEREGTSANAGVTTSD